MKRIHYIFLIAIMLFSCEKPISEFQSKNFIKFFGSGYESKGNDVIELTDGGYLITGYDLVNGSDQQIYVAKVDINGNVVWSNTFGDNGKKEEGKVAVELSDCYLFAGTSVVESSGRINSFIMKTNQYGDVKWRVLVGDPSFNVSINDIVVNGGNIYVAGFSDALAANRTDYYIAQIDTATHEKVWEKYFDYSTNSSFKRIFVQEEHLLIAGTYGIENNISITTNALDHFGPQTLPSLGSTGESMADAYLAGDQLYVLANNGLISSKLYKYNTTNQSAESLGDPINSIVGKSVAYNEDGTLMICGESNESGNSEINFIKVNVDGTTEYGQQVFRTFPGTVERIISTKDKGLILIGSTNPTYGTNIQLIKTDKDLFLLKP